MERPHDKYMVTGKHIFFGQIGDKQLLRVAKMAILSLSEIPRNDTTSIRDEYKVGQEEEIVRVEKLFKSSGYHCPLCPRNIHDIEENKGRKKLCSVHICATA